MFVFVCKITERHFNDKRSSGKVFVIPFADLPESRHRLSFIFGLEADPFSVDLAVPILATLEWIAKTHFSNILHISSTLFFPG